MSHSILIVDDDPLIRKLVATTLRDVGGFVLHEAVDGQDAVEVAERLNPTLVFLDIDMPRMDGIEACRLIRKATGTARATIVMLTASAQDTAAKRAEEAGADLFLTKPFSPLDLLRLVDQLGSSRA